MLNTNLADQLIKENALLREGFPALEAKYNSLEEKYNNLLGENTALREGISYLEEQNKHLTYQIYGATSEKLKNIIGACTSEVQEDQKEESKEDFDYTTAEEETAITEDNKPEGKKRGRRKPPANLAREQLNRDLPENEKTCAKCNCKLCDIGTETSNQYKFIPGRVVVVEHIRQKYACKNCGSTVKMASAPPRPLPKCMADSGLLSYILISKYQYHIPLYRQSKMFAGLGIDFSRATLCDWVLGCAKLFVGLYEALKKDVLSRTYLCADETPIQVLKEENKTPQSKSYMWVFMSGDKERRGIFFEYNPTRKSAVVSKVLSEFKGYLQTDAYSGYNDIRKNNGLLDIGCWGHARRDFCDVLKLTKNKSGKSRDTLHLISKLYEIEARADELDLSFEERRLLREKEARPIIENEIVPFMTELKSKAPPKHKLGKGASYILNNIDSLKAYLLDGRIRIDNVIIENAIRPLAQGRRNWLFMNSVEGAMATAIMYSLIETCRYTGISAERYLVYVLKILPTLPENTDLTSLLPYNIDASKLETVYDATDTEVVYAVNDIAQEDTS